MLHTRTFANSEMALGIQGPLRLDLTRLYCQYKSVSNICKDGAFDPAEATRDSHLQLSSTCIP
jgi:hypothetical protein